jgi:hypothetical protein
MHVDYHVWHRLAVPILLLSLVLLGAVLVPGIGGCAVPIKLFKAVKDLQRHEEGVYLIDNSASGINVKISIHDLEGIAKIRVFPTDFERD